MHTIEKTYRKINKLFIKVIGDDKSPDYDAIAKQVGNEALVECYIAYQSARTGATKFDKDDAPRELTLDWSGTEMPIFGTRAAKSGHPLATDIAIGQKLYAMPDDKLKVKLASMEAMGVSIKVDLDDATEVVIGQDDDADDDEKDITVSAAEYTLAVIYRNYRLAMAKLADQIIE